MERNWILVVAGVFLLLSGAWLAAGGSLPGTTGSGAHQLVGLERLLGLFPAALGVLIWFGAFPSRRK